VPISELAERLGGWPRRLAALCCLALAALTTVRAHGSGAALPGHPVVVAARDLAAGAALSAVDVRVRSWPDELRPAGALSRSGEAVGRRLGGPVRAGEALTTARLAGAGLATGLPPSLRAVPVDVRGAGLVHAGDTIDLVAADATDDPSGIGAAGAPVAHVVADGVRVLSVTGAAASRVDDDGADGVEVVVAVDRATALRIAAESGRELLATVRAPP
jgi:Flp pilus assembly protein CpaB